MSKTRKQKQLEALFMKILEQVRPPAGQVTELGGRRLAQGHRAAAPGAQMLLQSVPQACESHALKCLLLPSFQT